MNKVMVFAGYDKILELIYHEHVGNNVVVFIGYDNLISLVEQQAVYTI